MPAAWASALEDQHPRHHRLRPGSGRRRSPRAPVTFLAATRRPAGSCSRMRSTSTNGYWVGIWRTRRPISPELMRDGGRAGAGAEPGRRRLPARRPARARYGLGAGGGRGGRRGLAFSASSAFTITSRVMSKSLLIV